MNWIQQWHESLPSTNTLLKEKAEEGAKEGLVILAKSQTDGRGRLGRSFFSPNGSGLYMSFLLRPEYSAELCTRLTALSAVAVCRAVERISSQRPAIKWVNDVYLNEKKLCGILTQASATAVNSPPQWMIVGIGINLILPEGGFPREIAHLATALYPSHSDPDGLRQKMADAVLEEFASLYPAEQWESAVEKYRRLCFLPGRKVEVCRGAEHYPATVLRVNRDLSLQIQDTEGKEHALRSGEVSLKLS